MNKILTVLACLVGFNMVALAEDVNKDITSESYVIVTAGGSALSYMGSVYFVDEAILNSINLKGSDLTNDRLLAKEFDDLEARMNKLVNEHPRMFENENTSKSLNQYYELRNQKYRMLIEAESDGLLRMDRKSPQSQVGRRLAKGRGLKNLGKVGAAGIIGVLAINYLTSSQLNEDTNPSTESVVNVSAEQAAK